MSRSTLVLGAVLAACAYLVGLALDLFWLRLLTKPVPILVLAFAVFQRGDRRVAVGLLAGAIGDVCLVLPHGFLAGMLAFAVGHAAYVAAFWSWHRQPVWSALVPVVAYVSLCFGMMIDGTGPLTIPLAVYMLVIGAMIWRATACAEDDELEPAARWLPFIGAILFAFSDTLIGINRFVQPLAGATFPILLSYWAGQALIAAGTIARVGCVNRAVAVRAGRRSWTAGRWPAGSGAVPPLRPEPLRDE
jgi:alkenylglycerophosphocholine/alkenylglycerophosphoethanolamine hydrolase